MKPPMLFVLLCGVLVLGVSPTFAEDPQLTEQEVLHAWGQTQPVSEPFSEPVNPVGPRELTPLTDEELGQITGAGFPSFNGDSLPPFFQSFRGCIDCTVTITADAEQEYAFLKLTPALKGNFKSQ